MNEKKALVRNGRHMRPMLAVLERYNIGTVDGSGRGRWISERDIPVIRRRMEEDPTRIVNEGYIFVQGTCIHNHVIISDYVELFDRKD